MTVFSCIYLPTHTPVLTHKCDERRKTCPSECRVQFRFVSGEGRTPSSRYVSANTFPSTVSCLTSPLREELAGGTFAKKERDRKERLVEMRMFSVRGSKILRGYSGPHHQHGQAPQSDCRSDSAEVGGFSARYVLFQEPSTRPSTYDRLQAVISQREPRPTTARCKMFETTTRTWPISGSPEERSGFFGHANSMDGSMSDVDIRSRTHMYTHADRRSRKNIGRTSECETSINPLRHRRYMF
jgi:hypothetical protein